MFNHSLESADSIAATPKAFFVNELFLYTNSGREIDIQNLLQNIFIKESLYQSGITVEIYLKDNIGLLNELRLSGNEKVRLKISRREPKDQGSTLKGFQLDLYIMEIKDYAKTRPSEVTYTLECVSKHVYLNNKKLLAKAFNGNITNLIRSIIVSDLNSEITVEASSSSNIKGIYPNIQPLQGVSWLLRNCFDNGTPFYFFETPRHGLIFTSYKKIIDTFKADPYGTYNNFPTLRTSMGRESRIEDSFKEEKHKIFQIRSNLNISKLNAGTKGSFRAQLNKIDISNKSILNQKLNGEDFKNDWQYSYNRGKTLNGRAPVDNTMKIENEALVDFGAVKNYYISYNNLSFSDTLNPSLYNYHKPTDQSILESEARKHNLDTLKQEIVIPGDFDLTCGTIVNLQLLKNDDVSIEMEENTPISDDVLSGNHLVTAIIHQFGKDGYTMSVGLKKDSFILRQSGGDT